VADERVLRAIERVPREAFVPEDLREHAYDNTALGIGCGQTISQPLVVARMSELLELRPDDRVLDVGTNNGAHLVRAAMRCRTIVGFDYDSTQLGHAAREIRMRALGHAVVFAGDVTGTFPFRDGAFDVALFLDVIEHVVPRVAVLREIHRVLREGGRLLVSAPNRETRWRSTLRAAGLFSYSDPDHKIEYSRDEFLAELRAGGFEPIGPLMPVVLDTPWAGAIDAVGGLSLSLYYRLSRWKRDAALRRPADSTGFRAVATKHR
jgi:protein-L-isoaspartate(D-aspartate) O-methyltransferase